MQSHFQSACQSEALLENDFFLTPGTLNVGSGVQGSEA